MVLSRYILVICSYAATTIMNVAYGKDTPSSATDPEVREVRQLVDIFRKHMPQCLPGGLNPVAQIP